MFGNLETLKKEKKKQMFFEEAKKLLYLKTHLI